jgi:hypothetical protein
VKPVIRTALFAVLLSACNTPCQTLCVRMADYATECGYDVSDADLDACLDEQATADDQGACRQASDPVTLRNEWSCDDLQAFFD